MDKPVTVFKICNGGAKTGYFSACGYDLRYYMGRYVVARAQARPELYVFATEEDARNSGFVGTLFKARAQEEMPIPAFLNPRTGQRCYRRVKLIKNLGRIE